MPTARGWTAAATGIILVVVGWTLAAPDLERLGSAFAVAVAIAVVVVRGGGHRVGVERQVTPANLSSGAPATVSVTVTNEGRRSLPLLLVGDRVAGGIAAGSRFTLAGIEGGGSRALTYELVPARRGRMEIGPLQVTRIDPFGLARSRVYVGGRDEIIVRPRIEPLHSARRDPHRIGPNPASARRPLGSGDEDFYTLREYVEGDDLRKIHWASTAKRGRYTIRQEESRWQGRAAIVLDDRARVHDQAGFERAVEAAASLAALYAGRGFAFTMMTASSGGIAYGRGPIHLNRCLDLLAEVSLVGGTAAGGIGRAIAGHGASSASDLVLVTGTLDDEAAGSLARLAVRATRTVAVSFPQHRFGGHATKARWAGESSAVHHAAMLTRAGAQCLTLGPEDSLASVWAAPGRPGGGDAKWQNKPALV